MEERKLVQRAREGDTAAFAELYEEIYKDLYRFALYTLGNTEDAKDAVSEAVMDGFQEIGSLRKEEAFWGWIFRILSAKCRRKLKEYVRKTEELSENLEAKGKDMTESLDVRRAFFCLEEEERMILSMHLFGGYRTREIGEILNMNHNTVRSREKRALEKLEKMLSV